MKRTTAARKDIPASAGLDAETNETLDRLAAMQGVSHAEIIRRAIHLLASVNGILGKARQK
ncbi:MAG: hypothetical protein JWO59_680 [Chloroflexi bacterium]|nr:hypothetical protein [Chloroflexota bacterium]